MAHVHRNLPCIPFGARGWGFPPANDRRCRPKGVGGRVQLDAAIRHGPAEPARPGAGPRKSSRQRKASTRARESEEPLEPPQKRSRGAEKEARRRAAKKANLDEFDDLERRVAALIGRVTRLEEERRRRRGDDGLDDDDAQSSRVADAL